MSTAGALSASFRTAARLTGTADTAPRLTGSVKLLSHLGGTMAEETAKLKVGSTNVVELSGMKDRVTGLYPTDATVTCDLLTSAGVAVSGAAALTMTYVTNTAGKDTIYRGTIPYTVTLTDAAEYIARITATSSGVRRVIDLACVAETD